MSVPSRVSSLFLFGHSKMAQARFLTCENILLFPCINLKAAMVAMKLHILLLHYYENENLLYKRPNKSSHSCVDHRCPPLKVSCRLLSIFRPQQCTPTFCLLLIIGYFYYLLSVLLLSSLGLVCTVAGGRTFRGSWLLFSAALCSSSVVLCVHVRRFVWCRFWAVEFGGLFWKAKKLFLRRIF